MLFFAGNASEKCAMKIMDWMEEMKRTDNADNELKDLNKSMEMMAETYAQNSRKKASAKKVTNSSS